MPRVSVLMPTHNRAHLIGHALDSLFNQTEQDFELLVVADGCTDGTCDVVRAYADPRVRLYDLPKAPYFGYANRNVALREAKGEFVAFVAHDNVVFPDHLARLTALLDDTKTEWAYSQPLWVSTDGVIVPIGTNLTNCDELEYFLTVGNSIPATCIVFRRSCLDRYGFMPEHHPVAADWYHWHAMLGHGKGRNLAYLPTPTCLHFSADWRMSRHATHPDVRTWLQIADTSAWWPAALRYDIPAGVTEQSVIASAMQAGGSSWVERVRAASSMVLTRLAWDDIRETRPGLEAAHARVAALEIEVAAITGRCAELASDAEGAAAVSATLTREHEMALAECRQLTETVEKLMVEGVQLTAAHEALARQLAQAQEECARLGGSHEALGRAESSLADVRGREVALGHELAATLRSVSWRFTTPLRTIKRWANLVVPGSGKGAAS